MSEIRRFPIMICERRDHHPERRAVRAPRSVAWAVVEPARAMAKRNHDQSLERLAERGGLAPGELRCALEGKSLWPHFDDYTAERCAEDEAWLANLVAEMVR